MSNHKKPQRTSRFVKRFLLCGLEQSGRSTIRSIVIKGKELRRIKEKDVVLSYFQWRLTKDFDSPTITLMDLGGQWKALKPFVTNLSPSVFYGIQAILFVIDVVDKKKFDPAKNFLNLIWQKVHDYSPSARIFVLLNKVDQIPKSDKRQKTVDRIRHLLQESLKEEICFHETTFKDNSIKAALLAIFQEFIPEMSSQLEEQLQMGISVPITSDAFEKPLELSNSGTDDHLEISPPVEIPLSNIPTPSVSVPQMSLVSEPSTEDQEVSVDLSETNPSFKIARVEELLELFSQIQKSLNLTTVSLMSRDGRVLLNIGDDFEQFSDSIAIAHKSFEATVQQTPEDLELLIIETQDSFVAINQVTESLVLVTTGNTPAVSGISQKLVEFAREAAVLSS